MNHLSRKFGSVALLLSLSVILQGCSIAIARTNRFGPNPDRDFTAGVTREDIERKLGKPVESSELADGRLRTVYEYTVREGIWPTEHDLGYMITFDAISLGLAEVIQMPIAYFMKGKRTYLKEYIYHKDGSIAESSPERLKGSNGLK